MDEGFGRLILHGGFGGDRHVEVECADEIVIPLPRARPNKERHMEMETGSVWLGDVDLEGQCFLILEYVLEDSDKAVKLSKQMAVWRGWLYARAKSGSPLAPNDVGAILVRCFWTKLP